MRANLLAADSSLSGSVNVGWGRETSVIELVGALNDVGGDRGRLEPVFAPPRPGEVQRSCLDVSRARRELGGRPRSSFATGSVGRSRPSEQRYRFSATRGASRVKYHQPSTKIPG